MPQKTLVLTVPARAAAALRERLAAAGFDFRPAPHSVFSAKGPAGVATLYNSGKLVLQGPDPEGLARRILPDGIDPAAVGNRPGTGAGPGAGPGARADARSAGAARVTTVGSDESGKGDYFGPLVVASVRLDAETARALAGGEVRDCKTMSDESVLRVGGALRRSVPFAVERLDPPAYNAEHARVKNLNPMLAALHARAISKLASPGMRVVVDQFSKGGELARALAGQDVRLEERPRAEDAEIAVAAASVIAREEFLRALSELSSAWAIDLAKGAGTPTDRAAKRFVALHGAEKLAQVAKVHFKTTQKILGGAAR